MGNPRAKFHSCFMENGDLWLAPDKFQHILLCFSITILISFLSSLSHYSLLRRRSILIGSLVSAGVGAAKEFADELGFFHSAGASAKDVIADVVGIVLAVFVLSLWKRLILRRDRAVKESGVEMV